MHFGTASFCIVSIKNRTNFLDTLFLLKCTTLQRVTKKGKNVTPAEQDPKQSLLFMPLRCLVSRRLAPTALKTFFLLWQKWKWKKQLLAIFNVKHFCFLRGQIQSKLFDWKNLLVNYRTVNWFWSNLTRK